MECEALREEEFEALEAIYATELILSEHSASVQLSLAGDTKHEFVATLQFDLQPERYPLHEGPTVSISAPWMTADEKRSILSLIQDQIQDNIGQSMIYTLVESARADIEALISKHLEASQTETASRTSSRSSSECDSGNLPEIYHGEMIKDRKSTFQGHCAAVNSVEEARAVIDHLQRMKKTRDASHNMWAYRLVEAGIEKGDCYDDGELYAGSKLAQLLNIVDVRGVVVIVSRWYGGVHLGPDRFKHIRNATRDVLEKNGFIK